MQDIWLRQYKRKVLVQDIEFVQRSIKSSFSDGRTFDDFIGQVRSGRLNPDVANWTTPSGQKDLHQELLDGNVKPSDLPLMVAARRHVGVVGIVGQLSIADGMHASASFPDIVQFPGNLLTQSVRLSTGSLGGELCVRESVSATRLRTSSR